MSRFIHGIVIAATPVFVALAGAIALPAAAAPDCMTQDEARKAFPHDHLYWHGAKHCWDNVGKSRSRKPAATVTANAHTADAGAPSAPVQQPDADRPRRSAAQAPAVPFIGDDPIRVAAWPASALAAAAPAPAVEPPADSAPAAPAEDAPAESAQAENAQVVIGAPNAAPGSPDYLLEHCCWPPTVPKQPLNEALLPRMVVASASACGLAVGLWLFVYRRRKPVRARWT